MVGWPILVSPVEPARRTRSNSTLAPSEYRGPVLGLIFLAFAEYRFEEARPALEPLAGAVDFYPARGSLAENGMVAGTQIRTGR